MATLVDPPPPDSDTVRDSDTARPTLKTIAAATGFADGNYLAKTFRRHRGLSPLEFRATRAEAA